MDLLVAFIIYITFTVCIYVRSDDYLTFTMGYIFEQYEQKLSYIGRQ